MQTSRIPPYPARRPLDGISLTRQIDTLRVALFLDYAVVVRKVRRETIKRHRAGLETLRKRLNDFDGADLRSERDAIFNRLAVLIIARATPNGTAASQSRAFVANAVDVDDFQALGPAMGLEPGVVRLADAIVSIFTAGEPMPAAPALPMETINDTLAALAGVVAGWA